MKFKKFSKISTASAALALSLALLPTAAYAGDSSTSGTSFYVWKQGEDGTKEKFEYVSSMKVSPTRNGEPVWRPLHYGDVVNVSFSEVGFEKVYPDGEEEEIAPASYTATTSYTVKTFDEAQGDTSSYETDVDTTGTSFTITCDFVHKQSYFVVGELNVSLGEDAAAAGITTIQPEEGPDREYANVELFVEDPEGAAACAGGNGGEATPTTPTTSANTPQLANTGGELSLPLTITSLALITVGTGALVARKTRR